MEAQGDPFRRGLFPLQASLISPNFPARQPPGWCVEIFRVLCAAVAVQGIFWWFGRCGAVKSAAIAHDLWVGCVGRVYAFRKCRLIPLISRLRDKLPAVFFPPEGKPLHPLHFSQQDGRVEIRKIGCFCNSACILNFLFTSRNFIHQVRTGV